VPGDEIIGYITRGHGVTVHRRDCPNILRVREPERLIEVGWGTEKQTYPVMVHILAYDRAGLMRDIAGIMAAEDINMSSLSMTMNNNIVTFYTTLKISDSAQLSSVLAKIEQVPNVLEARRQAG